MKVTLVFDTTKEDDESRARRAMRADDYVCAMESFWQMLRSRNKHDGTPWNTQEIFDLYNRTLEEYGIHDIVEE